MVEVQILNKTYPLCLTVAALDEVTSLCGGLHRIGQFLDGEDAQYMILPEGEEPAQPVRNLAKMATNSLLMLDILLREGENNRIMRAQLEGVPAERRTVPDAGMLGQLLTVKSALTYRNAIMDAVAASMLREIEAEYPKNGKDAERK